MIWLNWLIWFEHRNIKVNTVNVNTLCVTVMLGRLFELFFFRLFRFLFFRTTSSCQPTWNWLSQSNKRTFIRSETRNDYFTPNMLYSLINEMNWACEIFCKHFINQQVIRLWQILFAHTLWNMINDEMCRFSRVFLLLFGTLKVLAKEADDMEWNWWKCANWLGSIKTEMLKCELFFFIF